MSLAYMGAPSRTAPCRGPELVSYRRDPAPQIGVFYTNFGNMHCPAASTGRAPDHRDRCWVRLLLCAKVLTESDLALGREGRIADPHRQEPDVNGNPTTPQIGGFYANFRSMRRQAASIGRAPITGIAAGYVLSRVKKFQPNRNRHSAGRGESRTPIAKSQM